MDQLLFNAINITRAAGGELMKYFRTPGLHIDNKLNDADIVTAADRASERVVIGSIRSIYPSHAILSEESGETQGSEYRWVIDPLDGTTNFTTGLPHFAVSIGIEHEGERVVGVVYAPALGELFTAVKGEGAYLNGVKRGHKTNKLLERAVVATGFPVDKDLNPDNNLLNVKRVLPHVRGMRRLGSASLDLSYVACGFLDAYWEMDLHEWDVSAGLLMCQEGAAPFKRFRVDRNVSVLAASPDIFPQIEKYIK